MIKRVTIAKSATAALAGLMALSAAAPVMAQPTGSYTAQSPKGYYYDPCKRETNQRGTAGGIVGGLAGAAIGSNVAARNARTEGALLGGLLGIIAGSVVANKTAACTSGHSDGGSPPPPLAGSKRPIMDATPMWTGPPPRSGTRPMPPTDAMSGPARSSIRLDRTTAPWPRARSICRTAVPRPGSFASAGTPQADTPSSTEGGPLTPRSEQELMIAVTALNWAVGCRVNGPAG